jgi:hypothetical protein
MKYGAKDNNSGRLCRALRKFDFIIAGRNATAGAINVYSNLPTETFMGDVSLIGGAYSPFKQQSDSDTFPNLCG